MVKVSHDRSHKAVLESYSNTTTELCWESTRGKIILKMPVDPPYQAGMLDLIPQKTVIFEVGWKEPIPESLWRSAWETFQRMRMLGRAEHPGTAPGAGRHASTPSNHPSLGVTAHSEDGDVNDHDGSLRNDQTELEWSFKASTISVKKDCAKEKVVAAEIFLMETWPADERNLVHGKDSTFALDQDGENVTETETLCIAAGQTSSHEDLLYCVDGVVEEGTVEAAVAALRRLQGDTYARLAGLVMSMYYSTYLEKERFEENVATIISETR